MHLANRDAFSGGRSLSTNLTVAGALIILLVLTGGGWTGSDVSFLIYPYCLLAVSVCLWALWSWRCNIGPLFNPYIIFFIMAWLFNAGQSLLEVLDQNPDGLLKGRISPSILVSTLQLVILGLVSLQVGALVSSLGTNRAPSTTTGHALAEVDVHIGESEPHVNALRLVGYALLAVSVIPTIMLLQGSISVVKSSGYTGLYGRNEATGFGAGPAVLASFFPTSVICLMLASKGRGVSFIVSLVGILLYSAITFFLGHRAYAAMPLIAYMWAYHQSVRRLPLTAICACTAFFLFVVFPLVRVIRDETGRNFFSPSELYDAYASIDNPVIDIVAEIGGSMVTVAYTLELVPSRRPFDMGEGYVYALLTLMPNLFWDLHPSIARMDAATWLVWEVDPSIASQGGGLGYSFIAEAYLNFGWTGTPVVLFLIGYGLGKLTSWTCNSDSLSRVALTACMLLSFSKFPRGESDSVFRPLLWYSFLPYIAVLLLARVNTQRRQRK